MCFETVFCTSSGDPLVYNRNTVDLSRSLHLTLSLPKRISVADISGEMQRSVDHWRALDALSVVGLFIYSRGCWHRKQNMPCNSKRDSWELLGPCGARGD